MAMLLDIPVISVAQMIEVDRIMIDVYHIELIQMMENAGRNLASLARSLFLDNSPSEKTVLILVGNGGNGGGGMVAARRLHNWGANIQVFLTHTANDYQGVPRHQLDVLNHMGVLINDPIDHLDKLPKADLLLDTLIGYSLAGNPRGYAGKLIRLANTHPAPILSLDVPSGVDSTSGEAYNPHIQATATLTLALPKTGLVTEHAQMQVGELFLADISVPPDLYAHIGVKVGHIFSKEEILKLS
jgi:NAD(P)H-hydrate epimerase